MYIYIYVYVYFKYLKYEPALFHVRHFFGLNILYL